jgi:hypothetical protein
MELMGRIVRKFRMKMPKKLLGKMLRMMPGKMPE